MFQFGWCPLNCYLSTKGELFTVQFPIKSERLLDSETAGSKTVDRLTDDIVGIQTSFFGQNRLGIHYRLYE
jgi:hypothetical protein